ncbi:MAG TPA: ZIP family metal transporter [Allosphingosinicella sp.]|uniref:ZIP family metal transporter n=1 Tax=Allosphingosinicella sp. TaxID=2823234 RepID=UPI002EDA651F
MDWKLIGLATGASAAAGLATAGGALPVFVVRDVSQKLQNAFLGFAAGVMLAASFFSLILPGLEVARERTGSLPISGGIVAAAILLGAATLHIVNKAAPHEHFITGPTDRAARSRLSRIWLFVIAISLHNFPEGLAVGVSFGGPEIGNGWTTAFGIGLQNVPEGLAVAVALVSVGYGRVFAFLVALGTGLIEPVGGFLGISAVSVASSLLPWGLGFAGGAMIWVVSSEIIPETHGKGHEGVATGALMSGLALMMFLDWTFG